VGQFKWPPAIYGCTVDYDPIVTLDIPSQTVYLYFDEVQVMVAVSLQSGSVSSHIGEYRSLPSSASNPITPITTDDEPIQHLEVCSGPASRTCCINRLATSWVRKLYVGHQSETGLKHNFIYNLHLLNTQSECLATSPRTVTATTDASNTVSSPSPMARYHRSSYWWRRRRRWWSAADTNVDVLLHIALQYKKFADIPFKALLDDSHYSDSTNQVFYVQVRSRKTTKKCESQTTKPIITPPGELRPSSTWRTMRTQRRWRVSSGHRRDWRNGENSSLISSHLSSQWTLSQH